MKSMLALAVMFLCVGGFAQKPAAPSAAGGDLESVLTQMDKKSGSFKAAQADFQADQYQKVVDETDVQKGQVFFKRSGNGIDASLKITAPATRYVVFKAGKLQMYDPKIDQLTERDESKNKSDVEAFMSLGFGGGGHDLLKNYDVKLAGWETVDTVKTARLELVAKSERFRGVYNKVVLWIDLDRDVSLKQQFFEPSGDYRLAHYSNIKVNSRFADDVFKIKTTSHTSVITPQ
jgi:outer membrane lipoprotein-sorting protein